MKLTNLMLTSLDGEITSQPGENSSQRLDLGLTNKDDQELLYQEIKAHDAVIIGASSVRVEGGILELKNKDGRYPTWCIYTRKGLNASLPFWQQNKSPKIFISPKPLFKKQDSRVEVLCYGDLPPGSFLIQELKTRGFQKVLLLGGGHVNRMFYGEKLVDELKLTLAPMLLGQGLNRLIEPSLPEPVRLALLSCKPKGSHLFLHYSIIPSQPSFSKADLYRSQTWG